MDQSITPKSPPEESDKHYSALLMVGSEKNIFPSIWEEISQYA